MCGIFGVTTHSNTAAALTFAGLKDIEYRGYDSWGVAYAQDDVIITQKDTGFLPKKVNFPSSHLAFGHTRWATHGGVTVDNAHPHKDCTGKLVMVHNGIVENFLELKNSLKNHDFKSQTDTEVIIHLIEEKMKKEPSLVKAVASAFKMLKGLNAVIVSDGQKIVAVKVGSPLVLGKISDGFVLASDPNALIPYTKDLIFLDDNTIVEMNSFINLYALKDLKKASVNFQTVDWDYSQADLNKFKYFMLKEMHEQPKVIRQIAKNIDGVKIASELIKKAFGTYFIGCGTAAFACLLGTYLFSKFSKKHVNFAPGSEFVYLEDFLKPRSLIIPVTQSGESIDVVEPVIAAKKKGVKVVSLVNVLGSSIYRLSDYPLMLSAGIEKGVASTKAMIAMVSYMIMLSLATSGKEKNATEILEKSAVETEKLLADVTGIKKLASKLFKSKSIYIIGRGLSYPVALEAALKIKELSYIHAEGFAGGELKHGAIALMEKGTPVIVFAPNDETYEAAISNSMEVKARGAYVVGIGYKNNPVFDSFIQVGDTGASSVIPHIVVAQLLAYYLTLKLKQNPDKPRNLAKSVVVR